MEKPGNVVRLADHPRRRKPAQRAIVPPDSAANYYCLRCEGDRFRLYASGMIHCAHCGALTELNDHLKLLFARAAKLFCRGCGKPVVRDTPGSIFESLLRKSPSDRAEITFPVPIPKNFTEKEIEAYLQAQGYTRLRSRSKDLIEVVQDRVKVSAEDRARITEALEAALKFGQGKVN